MPYLIQEEVRISEIIGLYDENLENSKLKQLYAEEFEFEENSELEGTARKKTNEVRDILLSFLKVLFYY